MNRFPSNDIISLVGEAPRYDLAESVGPDLLVAELLAKASDGFAQTQLGYRTPDGDKRIRQILADLHHVNPDDVVITIGGIHALFLLSFILCSRGGEAVVAMPIFPPARDTLLAVGADIRTLPITFEQGYQPDIDHFRALLSSRTKLVSLASPQNPSGVSIPAGTLRDMLTAMAQICPDAFLLVDETYREAVYGDALVAPSALALGGGSLSSDRVISVASLSKCHGAPGLRSGWAITRNKELRQQLVLGKFNTVISCSAVDEALALQVLSDRTRILADRRRRFASGVAQTADWVEQHKSFVEWVRPDAGAICCVRLRPEVFDNEAVNRFYSALKDARVASGTWFGESSRVFRLGFGLLEPDELAAGLAALGTALRAAR